MVTNLVSNRFVQPCMGLMNVSYMNDDFFNLNIRKGWQVYCVFLYYLVTNLVSNKFVEHCMDFMNISYMNDD